MPLGKNYWLVRPIMSCTSCALFFDRGTLVLNLLNEFPPGAYRKVDNRDYYFQSGEVIDDKTFGSTFLF